MSARILELMAGFRRSQVLFAAVELSIFDILAERAAGATAVAIAGAVRGESACVDGVERLLQACVGLELLTYHVKTNTYANTDAAKEFLTHAAEGSYVGYITHSSRLLYPLWGQLASAVREGTNRWKSVFDKDAADMFAHVYSTPAQLRQFTASMHSFGVGASPAVAAAVDLSRFHHLVDLGGGTGHFCVAACERAGQLRATVAELPAVVPVAREYVSRAPVTVRDRINVIAVDMFAADAAHALPATVDVISLSRILHDWDDDTCVRILKLAHAALPSGGGLILAEMLLDDDKTGPLSAQLQSLNMLVQTHGRERTVAEYTRLVQHAGFVFHSATRTGAYLDAFFAVKQ